MATVTKEAALKYHEEGKPGKIEVIPTKPYATQHDLALAYSPGVAYPCEEIESTPESVYKYTNKGNLVAVISNGTAVLGLGNIGPLAGKPVMEGKALLFKIFAGIDCFDIEVDQSDSEKFIETVKALSPTFGGINLEDIKAPECFEIESRLKAECNIPVMHDDQHGTAIISGAGLLNALEIQGKKIEDIKLVVNGAGAAAVSCTRLYIALGVKRENVVMCDSRGVINKKRKNLNAQKLEFVTDRDIDTLAEAMVGADVFLGLSVKDVVTTDMVRSMAAKPIVFALANPDPEISYEKAIASRPDLIFATGRSDYPNQINNVLGFPYIFRGALDCGASAINESMKLAAVKAIADLAKEPVPPVVNAAYDMSDMQFGREYILPKPMDPRLLTSVAPSVAKAAAESGIAKFPIIDWGAYEERLQRLKGNDNKLIRNLSEKARNHPRKVVFGEANTDQMLKAAVIAAKEKFIIPILLGNEEMIQKRAKKLGISVDGIEIVNLRHDREADRRKRYAIEFLQKRQRDGVTYPEALEKMFDRNYFGMMMVNTGDADAFLGGTYSSNHTVGDVAAEVVGISPEYNHFATMHIMETKKGLYFISDTQVNKHIDEDTLLDIAKMTRKAVEFFAQKPVMSIMSYSNFGSSNEEECVRSRHVVERMHELYPELDIDGEMSVSYALNTAMRDKVFPFNRLFGKEVNTLIFPNLSSASVAYRTMLEMGAGDAIGPIQMGLNKPIHFINVHSSVRNILNLAIIAGLDAEIASRTNNRMC